MKKNILLGAAIVAAMAVIGLAAAMGKGSPATGSTDAGRTGSRYKVVAACQAFNQHDAEAVLGPGATAGTTNGSSDSVSDDIAVSTCSYSSGGGQDVQATQTATLLARSAKSAAGAASNKSVFGADKPAGKQDVSGVGDKAFWDAQLSQLDILQGNNWYIIGNMSGTHADSGSLDVARTVYERIKGKM